MLQNAYFVAKTGADTAENEQHFAEILPTDARGDARLPGWGLSGGRRSRRREVEEEDCESALKRWKRRGDGGCHRENIRI